MRFTCGITKAYESALTQKTRFAHKVITAENLSAAYERDGGTCFDETCFDMHDFSISEYEEALKSFDG